MYEFTSTKNLFCNLEVWKVTWEKTCLFISEYEQLHILDFIYSMNYRL